MLFQHLSNFPQLNVGTFSSRLCCGTQRIDSSPPPSVFLCVCLLGFFLFLSVFSLPGGRGSYYWILWDHSSSVGIGRQFTLILDDIVCMHHPTIIVDFGKSSPIELVIWGGVFADEEKVCIDIFINDITRTDAETTSHKS